MRFHQTSDKSPNLISKEHGTRVALHFNKVVLSLSTSNVDLNGFYDLPRLQEISDHGDMGQWYSARLLRSVHPTAATERTDGIIRSDKARSRLEERPDGLGDIRESRLR